MSKTLPPGSWAVVATVNSTAPDVHIGSDLIAVDLVCELRNGSGLHRRRHRRGSGPEHRRGKAVALDERRRPDCLPAAAEVSVWCRSTDRDDVTYGQMMLTRVGGFS